MAMRVILRLLHRIDLVRYRLYILCLVWWDLLHSFCLPVYVCPVGHSLLALILVGYIHLAVVCVIEIVVKVYERRLQSMQRSGSGEVKSSLYIRLPRSRSGVVDACCGVVPSDLDREQAFES